VLTDIPLLKGTLQMGILRLVIGVAVAERGDINWRMERRPLVVERFVL
jgi:hypothetical protein